MTDYKDYPTTIIRADHGTENPYFMMLRDTAQNKSLSFDARGMLSYLLSRSDNWRLQPKDLQQCCGRNKVYRILNDLITAGHVVRWKAWNNKTKRIVGYYYEVHEYPVNPNDDLFPQNLHTANLHTAIGDITYKRDIQNTEVTKKDIAPKQVERDICCDDCNEVIHDGKCLCEDESFTCSHCKKKAQGIGWEISTCQECHERLYKDVGNGGFVDWIKDMEEFDDCAGDTMFESDEMKLTVEMAYVLESISNNTGLKSEVQKYCTPLHDMGYIKSRKYHDPQKGLFWVITDTGIAALEAYRAQQEDASGWKQAGKEVEEIMSECPTMQKYGECTAHEDSYFACLECEWQNELPVKLTVEDADNALFGKSLSKMEMRQLAYAHVFGHVGITTKKVTNTPNGDVINQLVEAGLLKRKTPRSKNYVLTPKGNQVCIDARGDFEKMIAEQKEIKQRDDNKPKPQGERKIKKRKRDTLTLSHIEMKRPEIYEQVKHLVGLWYSPLTFDDLTQSTKKQVVKIAGDYKDVSLDIIGKVYDMVKDYDGVTIAAMNTKGRIEQAMSKKQQKPKTNQYEHEIILENE
jgi:predicted transcriptional regulator